MLKKTMNQIASHNSLLRVFSWPCLISLFFSLLLLPVLGDDPTTSNSSNDKKAASKKSSGTSTQSKILIVFLALLATGAFGVFLYKLWQRKKREEQHARLLKLFEQDDDLEVELGMRD